MMQKLVVNRNENQVDVKEATQHKIYMFMNRTYDHAYTLGWVQTNTDRTSRFIWQGLNSAACTYGVVGTLEECLRYAISDGHHVYEFDNVQEFLKFVTIK